MGVCGLRENPMSSGDLPDVGDTTIEDPGDSEWNRYWRRLVYSVAAGAVTGVLVGALVGLLLWAVWVK